MTADASKSTSAAAPRAPSLGIGQILRQPTLLLLRAIDLEDVHCRDKRFFCEQGFGGRPLRHFPPYAFFRRSLEAPEAAAADFQQWYYHWLIERAAWQVPKSDGGWEDGSLVRHIAHLHRQAHGTWTGLGDADEQLVWDGIRQRVAQRLALFDTIRQQGLDVTRRPPIRCERRPEGIFVRNGHHRLSALLALDFQTVRVQLRSADR